MVQIPAQTNKRGITNQVSNSPLIQGSYAAVNLTSPKLGAMNSITELFDQQLSATIAPSSVLSSRGRLNTFWLQVTEAEVVWKGV